MRNKRNTSRTNPILAALREKAGTSPRREATIALRIMCLEGDSRADFPDRAWHYDAAMGKCTGPEIAFAIDVLSLLSFAHTRGFLPEVAIWDMDGGTIDLSTIDSIIDKELEVDDWSNPNMAHRGARLAIEKFVRFADPVDLLRRVAWNAYMAGLRGERP